MLKAKAIIIFLFLLIISESYFIWKYWQDLDQEIREIKAIFSELEIQK